MLTGKHILNCDCIDNDDLHRLFESADILQSAAKGRRWKLRPVSVHTTAKGLI